MIWAIVLAVTACGLGYGAAWRRAARDHRQMAALLLGLRDGDFGLRAAPARGPRGRAYAAFNALADSMAGDHRAGIESDALLGKLLAAVDLAILVIGSRSIIIGVNQAAETLLGQSGEQLLGTAAAAHGIGAWLDLAAPNRFETQLPGGAGPWEVRRLKFRRAGREHLMLVANDLSRTLREEERRVWRGLIRVLSHETGNSLGPIQAIAETLQTMVAPQTDTSMAEGLALIERRARSLAAFIRRYADLARLPPPVLEPVELAPILRRVAVLEARLPVAVEVEQDVMVLADSTQLEQALINLARNAADAALDDAAVPGGGVMLRLTTDGRHAMIDIVDDGPGLPKTDNMFIPGFTTKQGGSGIGLVLSREIIEAHGGALTLNTRIDAPGAIAQIRLRQFS